MRRRLSALLVAGAVGIAAVGLTACGGGGGGEEATDQSSAAETAAEQAAAEQAAQAARERKLAARVRQLIPIARRSQAEASEKERMKIANAEAQLWIIAGKSLEAVRPLLRALKDRDYELIADLDYFYIALGKPGSQQILADTVAELYPSGDPAYAGLPFGFLQAGNEKLTRLVTEALESAGYTITGNPGSVGLQWGESGAYGKVPLAPGVPAPPSP